MPETINEPIKVVKIIIGITANALNKLFTYQVPTDLIDKIEVGSVVLVPFGKGDSLKRGYVIEIDTLTESTEYQLKSVIRIEEQVMVENRLIQLAFWMHERYQCTLTSALRLMLPTNIDVKLLTRKTIYIDEKQTEAIKHYISMNAHSKKLQKRIELLSFMISVQPIIKGSGDSDELTSIPSSVESSGVSEDPSPVIRTFIEQEILSRFNTSSALIKSLEQIKLITRKDETVSRNIHILRNRNKVIKPVLNDEQKCAVDQIASSSNEHSTFLIHGVTGSGKTEVYMSIIEKVLEQQKNAIVLIPEIGLTPQTIERFISRFGNIVGVMHSRLNAGERYEQWIKARDGETKIMIGARSAVFAPYENIGVIIIDEEHEHTYKSEQNPRYHAREVAIKRGIDGNFPVVLGSATPLVESYHKAMLNQYKLIELNKRAVKDAHKTTEIIDMRSELESGNTSVLSSTLREAMEHALGLKQQVILFLNRRGYANSLSCRKCGFVYRCDHCDVSMNYHKSINRLMCHLCGDSKKVQTTCPKCGSTYIKAFGAGTQRIESYIQSEFPAAVVGRMDQDSTSGKFGHEKILKEFADNKINILIGTQMIAKGHDFHNVTVVGVLAADLSLNTDDFRAGERTFQLITQVIGRTGRGELSGRAIIQTYQPEHYAIVQSVNENYNEFYKEEDLFRKTMIYPPYCQLLEIVCMSEQEYAAKSFLTDHLGLIKSILALKEDPVDVILGPSKTSIGKINGFYRYRVLIKGTSYKKLTLIMKELYNRKDNNTKFKNLKLTMDMNPMNLS